MTKRISLRIAESKLSTLTYDSEATNQYEYTALNLSPVVENVRKAIGENLNGSGFCHILYAKKEIDIVISADEIDSTQKAFLSNWFKAPYAYISLNSGSGFGNYIRVYTESGRVPWSYIDGIIDLPEISFTIFYKDV